MTYTSSYLLHVLVVISASLINTIDAANPTFLVPIASTASRSVSEDEAPTTSILTLEGQDTDGDTLTFSIVTQNPTSPPFELESVTGLLKVPSGLDAEVSTSYEFVFGVRDGSTTTNSVLYRVNIRDVNDNKPIFSSPSSARVPVFNTANVGTNVTRVNATDADVTPATITYSIVSGNNLTLFALDANTGQITVSANLSTYIQDFNLTLQASDGTFTAVTPATVTITVTVDYCMSNDGPCQNGGTCTNMDNGYNCSCAEGFLGQNCSQATGGEGNETGGKCKEGCYIPIIVGGCLICVGATVFLFTKKFCQRPFCKKIKEKS